MQQLIDSLEEIVQLDVETALNEVLSRKQLKEYIEGVNKYQLYIRGVDGEGRPLGEYAEATKKSKARKGLPDGHITLFDKGAYFASKEILIEDGGFRMIEDPIKNGYSLYKRFGVDIAGWDNVSVDNIIGAVKLELVNYVRRKMGLEEYGIIYPGNVF